MLSETFALQFPSTDDADVAGYSLADCLATVEEVDRFDWSAEGDLVSVSVTLTESADEDAWRGVEAALDNWASSSGGYFA